MHVERAPVRLDEQAEGGLVAGLGGVEQLPLGRALSVHVSHQAHGVLDERGAGISSRASSSAQARVAIR